MANTLTNGATVLTLSPDLQWTDEFAWPSVEQSTAYTIAGALIVEASVKLAGRTITLVGGGNFGWMTRADMLTLAAWRNQPGLQMTLVLRDEAPRTVVFNHGGGALESRPVLDFSDPVAADYCVPTLRFLEV